MAVGKVYILLISMVCLLAAVVIFSSLSPHFMTSVMPKETSQTTMAASSVIVVGGGLAGLSATIEAARHGAHVTIIEKEKNIGGNSAKATSGMNAVGTSAQAALDIQDTISDFVKDTIQSGDGLADAELVNILAANSNGAFEFLSSFGLGLTDVVQLGGHSTKRTHRFPPTAEGKPVPVGFTIMSTLRKYVENDNKTVTVMPNSMFKELVIENNKVAGVKVVNNDGTETIVKGTVVLTAGGYGNDHTQTSLLTKHAPHLAGYPTTNGPWATGDILKVVEPMGVSLMHMDKVQVHPTGFVDPKDPGFHTKFLAPEALRGCGALLLDANGKRFVNELGRRDYVTKEILEKCEKFGPGEGSPIVTTMLLSQKVIDKFGPHLAGFYKFKGLINDVGTLKEAAAKIGVPVDTLKTTIADYNTAAEKGNDSFGKTAFPTIFSEDDHFLVAFVTPSIHYCMGGIQINAKAEALGQFAGMVSDGKAAISGLYAAGEVSGGVHGNNRLGGNSLLECVVFGRIAGREAAHFNQ